MLMASRRAIREKTRKEIEKRKNQDSNVLDTLPVETVKVEPKGNMPVKPEAAPEFILKPETIEIEGKKITVTAPPVPAGLQARHDKKMTAQPEAVSKVESEDEEEDEESSSPIREISKEEVERRRKLKKGK